MCARSAYKSLGGAVESMSVVSPELGVGTLEGGVSGSLGLLDTAVLSRVSPLFVLLCSVGVRFVVPVPVRLARLVVLRRVLGLWNRFSQYFCL